MKRLYRSNDNKVLAGVIGGLGEYFDMDPVLLRLGYVCLAVFTAFAPGIIAYIVAIFVVPQKPAGQ
jgi:phage shock protein C